MPLFKLTIHDRDKWVVEVEAADEGDALKFAQELDGNPQTWLDLNTDEDCRRINDVTWVDGEYDIDVVERINETPPAPAKNQ